MTDKFKEAAMTTFMDIKDFTEMRQLIEASFGPIAAFTFRLGYQLRCIHQKRLLQVLNESRKKETVNGQGN